LQTRKNSSSKIGRIEKRIEKQNSQLIEEIHSVFPKWEESRNLLPKNMGRIKKDKS